MPTKKKTKRSYNKNTIKRKLFTISTDMKHLQKAFTKLQNDVEALREISMMK
jgi:outer membrane murein-binding lipoprotein Lpp